MAHTGSSPLTRGKPRHVFVSRGGLGLIPAHAGKTSSRAYAQLRRRAHPRSRGENPAPGKLIGLCTGSSPLTRGKLDVYCAGRIDERLIPAHAGKTEVASTMSETKGLIPAHAGKTRSRSCSFYPGRAHPRSRGENQLACLVRGRRDGSSPLTRGKHRKRARLTPRLGLIPAHAGKTLQQRA